jgi:pyruvate dehydrogenase (quinone)
MSQNVADYLIHRLHAWGVRRIYGFPGDGINGIMGALNRAEDTDHAIRFVQARHEEEAAFMACAHAKWTGEVGVCLATSGPGAIHLLNGLYDAKMDHVPVLAIVGQQARQGLGAFFQQEVDLTTLFKDVAHEYVFQASVPAQTRHLVDEAYRIATAMRVVTMLAFPNDLQEEPYEEPERVHGSTFSGIGYSVPHIVPRDEDLQRAADVLNAGEKVAMLVGAGALGATDEVVDTADVLGAGIAKALLGKAAVADTLPFVTGSIGLLGTEPSSDMMRDCDTLLMVGTSFPYAEFLPEEGQARAVQIDISPKRLGLRYPTEVNLHGDAADTLRALRPLLRPKEDRGWRQSIEKKVAEWWDVMEERAQNEADPINPQYVFHALSPRLPDDAILSADSGSAANWFARHLKARPGMMASLSGGLATMCPGVPYLLAAKFTHPERPAFAFVGDGAMQMLGNNALITLAKYWQEWEDPRCVVLVLNNQDLNQVTWEQRVMEGDPKFDASQKVPDFAYDAYAERLGLRGLRMERREDVERVWDEALAVERPVVINAYVDPEVPPLPPHISFEQAQHFLQALVRDPARGDMAKQAAKGSISALKEKITP